MPEKFILDATAGYRMMWFNKKHPNTIYLDQRPECEPDIVGDFRQLKEFADESFHLVIFDPPHEVRTKEPSIEMLQNYGWLRSETWQSDLKHGFSECMRVLKLYGVLIFKWSETARSLKSVHRCFPCEPLFCQKTKDSLPRDHKKRATATWWFCFMKIPEEASL
jgi:23S rRNA G2069 N7-methylase RlmK/C1962 C5-methylase RlmI